MTGIFCQISADTSHLVLTKGQQDKFTSIPCSCLSFCVTQGLEGAAAFTGHKKRQIQDEAARAERRGGKLTSFLVH